MNSTNEEVHRGQIWFVTAFENNQACGCEMRANHYAVIVSNETNNEKSGAVEVVYTTTSERKAGIMRHLHIPVINKNRCVTVLCEQIHTVAKSRLATCTGTLTENEMAEVDGALAVSLGLGLPKHPAVPQP